MYAGLRIEDEAALLEAKKEGAELMARTDDAIVYGYTKDYATGRALVRITFRDKLSFIRTSDPEPVNIDAALLQIAAMEAAQTPTLPPTWNDAINAMSAEEKVEMIGQIANGSCAYCVLTRKDVSCMNTDCKKCIAELFASPYDGGKAQEGAK